VSLDNVEGGSMDTLAKVLIVGLDLLKLYPMILFLASLITGFFLRTLRMPLDWYVYKWRPFLYIGFAFKWLAVVATVLILPWVVGNFVEKPQVHNLFFMAIVLIGYVIGAWPGRVLYEWLVRRESKKNKVTHLATVFPSP